MAENLFKLADLKTGIFNADGTYNQWRTASRCIEIPVAANTTYYFRYGTVSCNFAHVLLVSSSGSVEKYGVLSVITTKADTSSLKITFADDLILLVSSLDYSRFILSTDPFTDTVPFTPEVTLNGYYPIVTGNYAVKSEMYRSFGIICQPGHTYKVQNMGSDVPIFGINQYSKSGEYLSRVTSSSSTTAAPNAVMLGFVFTTEQYNDLTNINIVDTNAGPVEPPVPVFGYGTPYYAGAQLRAGTPVDGKIVLPYHDAETGKSYEITCELTGSGADGLRSPVNTTGAFAESGNIELTLVGTPAVAGGLTVTLTGTDIAAPIVLTLTVADSGTVTPTETYHYVKVPCKPQTTYQFLYGGIQSTGAVFSFFNGATFIRQERNLSVITTPSNCNALGINLPDSTYTDCTKVSLTEVGTGEYKSLVQLTQDVASLQESSTPTEPTPPYYDINFYLFGDSITAANITRWVPTFMSLMTFKHIENFAVGGANYTCSADVVEDLSGLQQGSSNKIWNQLNRLKAKVAAGESPVPDVIVVLAGINDRYSQLGDPETAFDYTVDYSAIQVTDPLTHNLAGAFRFTLEAILNEWPDVRIIIATPLPVGASTREKLKADNATVEAITHTLTTCARKMGLPVINQAYECGISPYREVGEYLHYNADGLHPNQHGGEKIGKYLARKLTEML